MRLKSGVIVLLQILNLTGESVIKPQEILDCNYWFVKVTLVCATDFDKGVEWHFNDKQPYFKLAVNGWLFSHDPTCVTLRHDVIFLRCV